MDARKEFEIRAKNMGYDLRWSGVYCDPNTLELFLGYNMAVEVYKPEIKKLKDVSRDLVKQLKICMVGYRRESARMPNCDISESVMWEVFNHAIIRAEEALRDGE